MITHQTIIPINKHKTLPQYASSAGMDHGPSVDPSPPRPVYFNELNSHIGKNKPKPMPRNPNPISN